MLFHKTNGKNNRVKQQKDKHHSTGIIQYVAKF